MIKFLFGRMFYIDLIITGFVFTAHLPKREHFWLRVCAALAACTAFSYAMPTLLGGFELGTMLNGVVSYVLPLAAVLLSVCFCVELWGYSALFIGAGMWFVQHFASVFDSVAFPNNGMNYTSFAIHVAELLVIVLAAYWAIFRKVECQVIERIDLRAALPIWFIVSLACLVLGTYAEAAGENSLSFKAMNMLCTAVGLLYQSSLYQMCGVERERDGVQKLLQESEQRYELAKRSTELVNIKCHDLRHAIRDFKQQGKLDADTFAEIEQTIREYDSAIKTGCPALDVILSEKSAQCVSLGIGFTCMADAAGLAYIKPVDMYVLFGNAIENAIEAVQQLADPEKKQISLTVRRVGGFCSVQLQNYSSQKLQFVGEVPITGKEDKQNHGFGVKSMRMLVERYEGELHFKQEGEVVELYILLPCKL